MYSGKEGLEIARNFGLELVRKAPSPQERPGTLTGNFERKGIPSIGTEIGCSVAMPDVARRLIDLGVKCVTNAMKYLGMIEGKLELPESIKILEYSPIMACDSGGFWIQEPTVKLGEKVSKGTLLARIVDFFGEEVERVVAPFDGVVMGTRLNPVCRPGEYTISFRKIKELIKLR